jgi:D-alanyl-lipoteichoic acid acyltransferase DltB (MBOAT superfamily)
MGHTAGRFEFTGGLSRILSMSPHLLIVGLLGYVLAGRAVMRRLKGLSREVLFVALNLAGVFFFLFYGHHDHFALRFIVYLALAGMQYLALRFFVTQKGWRPWLAFFTPILILIMIRYIPGSVYITLSHALGKNWAGAPTMIGISYLAFRCSRLVLEVRNGAVPMPGFLAYLNFCFFLPTMPVGPINSYENYRRGFSAPYPVPTSRAALRILVGAVKYLFLGSLCSQLSYAGLLQDDHPHHWVDLPVAMLFYYLYLYCNFSGFCDMAIGAAALIGIPVPENFANPFAARNVRDFWNRWHITLSTYMRDVVFAPLSKFFVRLCGAQNVNHAIALTIGLVFLLVGIWHGAGWNFAVYGLVHALGVVGNHYYTIFLKHRLGREGFKAYNENRWIHAAAVGLTFGYCAASLIFFANTLPQIHGIILSLR